MGQDLWQAILQSLDEVMDYLYLSKGIKKYLKKLRQTTVVSVIAKLDDDINIFDGYRVHHNIKKSPAKGGISCHQDFTLNEITTIAVLIASRFDVVSIPYSGTMGGIKINPKKLSSKKLEKLIRRYTSELIPAIGPQRDILALDPNTSLRIIARILDTHGIDKEYIIPGALTRKTKKPGGSEVGKEASDRDFEYVTLPELKVLKMNKSVSDEMIQGNI